MKKYIFPLIIILFLTFTLIGDCADWLEGWDKRIELKIEDYAGDIGASVTWFPVTVFLTGSQAEEVFVELTSDAEYLKTAVTKADGTTEMFAEFELFDVSETKGIFHTSIDGWTINANTSIFLYYDKDHADNTTYIGTIGERTEVWNDEYRLVMHMNDLDYDIVNECDAPPDWSVVDGTRSIDTGDKYSGTGSLKLVTDPAVGAGLLYYNPAGTWDWSSKTHLKVWIKGDTAEVGRFFIFDVGNNWEYWDFTYPTTWTLMSFDLSSPDADDGTGLGDWSDIDRIRFDIYAAEKTARYDEIRIYPGATKIRMIDSTSNNNDGTKKGIDEPIEVTGKVGQGQDFDGDNDYISAGDVLEATDNFTVEAIFKADDISVARTIVSKRESDGSFEGWQLRLSSDTSIFGFVTYSGDDISKTATVDSMGTDTHYIALAITNLVGQLYLDDTAVGTTTTATGAVTETNANFSIGTMNNALTLMDGMLDEVRISSVGRAATWLKGTKSTLWDDLFTYGSEETEAEEVAVNAVFFGINF